MVSEDGNRSTSASVSVPRMVEPGVERSPEMLELAALTRPGPFGKRTQELGCYVGMIDSRDHCLASLPCRSCRTVSSLDSGDWSAVG